MKEYTKTIVIPHGDKMYISDTSCLIKTDVIPRNEMSKNKSGSLKTSFDSSIATGNNNVNN
jgi:hypothetical protein